MPVTLRTIPEAAPQFRKTETAFRQWARTPDFPLAIVRLGKRIYIPQESIDKFFTDALKEAS
jgi:hypothetical protein